MRSSTRRNLLAGLGSLLAGVLGIVRRADAWRLITPLLMSSAPPISTPRQTIGTITVSPTTFTSEVANGVIGAISIPMSPASPSFSGTVAIGGTNSGGLQLSSTTFPCNLIQSAAGTASGTYTDFTITPTQVGASGSGIAQSGFSVTGSTAITGLTAEITFPGGSPVAGTLVYSMSGATNLGNYVAPTAGFTQQCFRARNSGLANFFVDFRPDVSGGRIEVVFWNGEVFGTVPSGHTNDLPAYNAVIKNTGTVIYSLSLPFHYWGTRWRYQSAPRPKIRTAAQIFSQGWLPHMSQTAARITGYSGIIVPQPTASIWASSGHTSWTPFDPITDPVVGSDLGILCANDSGGGRLEEGLITEWKAEALLFDGTQQGDKAYADIIQQAEMIGSQWTSAFLPDQVTGAPVNFKQDITHYASYTRNPYTSPYGSYYRIQGGTIHSVYNTTGSEHIANYFYVPYAFTEDPFYIEGSQFVCQYDNGWDIYHKENDIGHLASDPTGNSGIAGPFTVFSNQSEPRNIGWGVRNTAIAYKLAPSSPPSWLLPKSYYAAVGQDQSKVINITLVNSTNTFQTIFFNPCKYDFLQLFETSYFYLSVGFADLVGLPAAAGASWFSILTFFFQQMTAVTNGTSGWSNQNPLVTNEVSTYFDNVANPSGYFTSWGTFWTAAAANLTGAHDPSGGQYYLKYPGNPSPQFQEYPGSVDNLSDMTAACAIAKSRSVTAAAAAFSWMNSLVDASYPLVMYEQAYAYRWAFDGT